jgi:hypothetical protein
MGETRSKKEKPGDQPGFFRKQLRMNTYVVLSRMNGYKKIAEPKNSQPS